MTEYHLAYTPRACRDIQELDPVVQKRLAVKMMQLQRNPLELSRKLSSPLIGSYRYRVGDYRVIFDLRGNTLVVLRIGHRKDIYR